MSGVSPPLRFLTLVVGGWACLRGAMLAPDWWVETGQAAPAAPLAQSSRPPAMAAVPTRAAEGEVQAVLPALMAEAAKPRDAVASGSPIDLRPAYGAPAAAPPFVELAAPHAAVVASVQTVPYSPLPERRRGNRWSGSAWMVSRHEPGGGALAPGGTLGGSQAGLRLLYRVNGDAARPLALSARLYLPLRQRSAAEVAAGIDWRPFRQVPVHLLAERRQALGGDGRSAFALTVYGGHGGALGRRLRYDAYAQAGVVGLRSRDLFVDGAARLWVPAGRFEAGAAIWGAAQPGAERLDAGPQVSYRLPLRGTDVRLSADWRFRLAGDAAPASGPAFTLASDF